MALEFRANQLEQITGRKVTGGIITSSGVQFRLAATEAPDLAQLRDVFGRGVRARTGSSGEVSVEVGDQAGRVPLGQVIADRELPRMTVVLGIDNAGAPVMLDLAQPTSHHLLIAGTGKDGAALLHTAALSLAMLNRQRDLQLLPIGKFPWQTWPHRLDMSLRELTMLVGRPRTGTGFRPALVVVIDNLDGLTATDQARVKTLLRTNVAAGVHIIATAANVDTWPRFQAVARQTDEPEIWQLTTSSDQLEMQAVLVSFDETKTAINQIRAGRKSRVWTVQETLPARRSILRLLGGK